MNNREFDVEWERKKEQLRKDYPQLNEEDLHYEPGNPEELLDRLQKKLGKTKQEIRNWLHIMG